MDINKMSFTQLRNALAECRGTDPLREMLIRKMMMKRYLEYQQYRRNKNVKKIEPNYYPEMIQLEDDVQDRSINLSEFPDLEVQETSLNEMENMQFEPIESLVDPKYLSEMQKDHLNNNLMFRMSNDIDLKKSYQNKKKKRDCIKPFSDDPNEGFAPFKSTKTNNHLKKF